MTRYIDRYYLNGELYGIKFFEYTVLFYSNDDSYGTVDTPSISAKPGTTVTVSSNTITIGDDTVTATAETGYVFDHWEWQNGSLISDGSFELTEVNGYILALFEQAPAPATQHTVAFTDDGTQLGVVDVASATVDDLTVITVNNNTLTFGNTTVTAIPETGCMFEYWEYEGNQLSNGDTVMIQNDGEFTAYFDYDPQAVQQSAVASVEDELDGIDPNDFLNVLGQQ